MDKKEKKVLEILKRWGFPMSSLELEEEMNKAKYVFDVGQSRISITEVRRIITKLMASGYIAEGHRAFGADRRVFYLKDGVNVN